MHKSKQENITAAKNLWDARETRKANRIAEQVERTANRTDEQVAKQKERKASQKAKVAQLKKDKEWWH